MSRPGPSLQAWRDPGGAVWVTRLGRGWLSVPAPVWAAFTGRVRRGEQIVLPGRALDAPTSPPPGQG